MTASSSKPLFSRSATTNTTDPAANATANFNTANFNPSYAIGKSFNEQLQGFAMLASVLNTAVSLAIITVLFALIYKLLPSRPIAWSDVWMGAFVTSVLFSLGKYGIGFYLGTVALSSSFGAAGAFVVLMVWIYYAAQVFLLGAEFTYHYAVRHGSLQADDSTMPQAASV